MVGQNQLAPIDEPAALSIGGGESGTGFAVTDAFGVPFARTSGALDRRTVITVDDTVPVRRWCRQPAPSPSSGMPMILPV
jgi:hypothetical protein